MGLTFRKSVKIGSGTRLNFSSSGIGISTGVKGFRVSTGPRGTYVTIGGHGIYYREKIAGPYGASDYQPARDGVGDAPLYGVEKLPVNADALDLVTKDGQAVLTDINATTNQPITWPSLALRGFLFSLFGIPGLAVLCFLLDSL